ncbi:MAG TPA: SRPBCC family protein [Planctomycetota bacterium]|nr:SRPBCC family protein [Planctomycetota bacterium]
MDAKRDLVLERVVDVPPELIWKAWTDPKHLTPWFTPDPWKTVGCEIDLRPGGRFHTVMRSPEGQEFPSDGCYLEIVPNRRLVWTSALEPGYRPAKRTATPGHECEELLFTCVLTLEPQGKGTKYTATALHMTEADAAKHATMGFHEGWGKCLDQLVAYVKTL